MIVRARFREQEPVPGLTASNEARALAMAYAIEEAVERGRYASVAVVARALCISRARASQIMRRRLTTVGEQERILGAAEGGDRG
jgi:hypothetical protein